MLFRISVLLLSFFAALPLRAGIEAPLLGRVVEVTPSNSIVVRLDGLGERQVVLANIAIPAGDQPYAPRAHEVLRAQLLGRRVNVREARAARGDQDYIAGLVYVGRHNLNVDLIRRGHAWIDPLDSPHPVWLRFQAEAKLAKRGLWAGESPKHPFDYRRDQRETAVLTDTFSEISQSEVVEQMKRVLIGIRPLGVTVPLSCPLWARYRQVQLIIFTTQASASAAGYSRAPCDPSALVTTE